MNLPERIVAVHQGFEAADVPHGFGGAIALAWCVPDARATIDLDINVFLPVEQAGRAVAGLPRGVEVGRDALDLITQDGQVRLWWEHTPIDLFFNTTPFHEAASLRTRREPFGPVDLPVLACSDLAVFKAFFDRPKDWVDLQAMAAGGTLDVAAVTGVLVDLLGADDPRIGRIRGLAQG